MVKSTRSAQYIFILGLSFLSYKLGATQTCYNKDDLLRLNAIRICMTQVSFGECGNLIKDTLYGDSSLKPQALQAAQSLKDNQSLAQKNLAVALADTFVEEDLIKRKTLSSPLTELQFLESLYLKSKNQKKDETNNLKWTVSEETSFLLLKVRIAAMRRLVNRPPSETFSEPRLLPMGGGLYYDWANNPNEPWDEFVAEAFNKTLQESWFDRPAMEFKTQFYNHLSQIVLTHLQTNRKREKLIRLGTRMTVEDFFWSYPNVDKIFVEKMKAQGLYFSIRMDQKGIARFYYNPEKNRKNLFQSRSNSISRTSRTSTKKAGRGPASLAPIKETLLAPIAITDQFLDKMIPKSKNHLFSLVNLDKPHQPHLCKTVQKAKEFLIATSPVKKLKCNTQNNPKSILISNFSKNPVEVHFDYTPNSQEVSGLQFREVRSGGVFGSMAFQRAETLSLMPHHSKKRDLATEVFQITNTAYQSLKECCNDRQCGLKK